jgi:uncharacterized protein (DUF2147 family)
MTRVGLAAVAGLGLALASVQAGHATTTTDIAGVWVAQARNAHVEISRCGEGYCGKIISAAPAKSNPRLLDIHNKDPSLRQRSMIGTTFMEGFTGGPVKWSGGKLYNPGDGNFYSGMLTLLDEDHLQLKGCAFWFLCKSQTWTRLKS